MRQGPAVVSFALVAGLLAAASPARSGEMPSDIEWKLAEMGDAIDQPATAKIYAPLQEKEPYAGVKVTRDIKYGPDQRNALDMFMAEQSGPDPRPVLIFVHGGAFVAGARRGPGSPFYDNVMLFAVRNGMVGVNATYRLAPQHQWPAGAQDIGAAVRWVNDNIAAHGGDPGRVFLMGHSAGAVHVASYVADGRFHNPKGIGLAGAILVSGFYDLTTMAPGAMGKSYFGEDTSKYAGRSPLAGLAASSMPLMAAYAELDPDVFQSQTKQLNDALCKAGRCPRLVALPKHSHMSEIYAINTADTSLSDAILAFVKQSASAKR